MTVEHGQLRVDDATIDYAVRRSRRRRKTIEIQIRDGAVVVAAPARTAPGEIEAIIRKRAAWIVRHRDTTRDAVPRQFITGDSVPYRGRDHAIVVRAAVRDDVAIRLADGRFEVECPPGLDDEERRTEVSEAFERWFRAAAAELIPDRVSHWGARSGHRAGRVLIRNQRRRWASCGADGTLRFNWRLVLADPALLDYVVVHELAHLAVRNHSAAFWAEVERIMPDHRDRRAALREAAPTLTL